MRYRKLDENGDMVFGGGQSDYLVNSPEAVAQAIGTRLRLLLGEWFLDASQGTPYHPDILGAHTQATRDLAVRDTILGTQGVTELLSYSSSVGDRNFSVAATVDTVYGATSLEVSL